MPPLSEVALHFFLQMAVILATYRLLWPLFRRLHQMQVVAIMVAGFALGPSLLGAVAPDVQEWLFPQTVDVGGESVTHPSLTALYVVGQLGLVLYMFIVGTAFNTGILAQHLRHAAATSAAGIGTPMLLGGVVGWAMVEGGGEFFPDGVSAWQAALFVAAAVSITAFPMLAWIIYDSGLTHTRIGTMALACAAADDAAAWILLAAVVASTEDDPATAVEAIVGGGAYLVLMMTVGRRLLARLGRWSDEQTERGESLPIGALVTVMLVVLLGAWFTDEVGIYAVFGAFVVGAVMPRGKLADTLRENLQPLTSYVLVPAFFVYSGLNTKLSLVFERTTLIMLGVVLLVAFVGKGVAVALAARSQGVAWREAGALGALMNARGLMELILLNIGLNAGIVTERLYTVLALMTIITTFAASPLYDWITGAKRGGGKGPEADGEAAAHGEPGVGAAPPEAVPQGGAVVREAAAPVPEVRAPRKESPAVPEASG